MSNDTHELAGLKAELATARQRIFRDRDHAKQMTDPKVRAEVELYIVELERLADALAAEIAVLTMAENETLPEAEKDIAALKPPAEPEQDA